MRTQRKLLVGLLFTSVLIGLPAASWAQSTGSIAGAVTDRTGGVLPGVTVEATSPALIEGGRTTVTDGAGRYGLEALRPGVYTVTFRLQGFSTFVREGIELTTAFTATVNAEMTVGALEETVTVSGAAPLVDVQNVVSRENLSRETIDSLPTGKTWAGYAALTVGVEPTDRGDVGGSTSDGFAFVKTHGSRGDDGMAQVDGMSISDQTSTSGGFSKHYVVNQAAIHEVNITTSAMSAEVETGGAVVNAVPKDGGNTFSYYVNLSGTSGDLQSPNLDDALRARGASQEIQLKKIWDYQVGVGGPIMRDRLWFYTAHRWSGAQEFQPANFYNKFPNSFTYEADMDRPGFSNNNFRDNSFRLTAQAAEKHKLTLSYSHQRNCLCQIGGFGEPIAGEATFDYVSTPEILTQGTWTYPATNRLLFEAGATYHNSNVKPAQQPEASPDTISILELSRFFQYNHYVYFGPYAVGPGALADILEYNQFNQRFSMSYVTGTHSLKVGVTAFQGVENNQNIQIPNDVQYQFFFGGPVGLTQFATPGNDRNSVLNLGIFAQDRWTVNRLTLNLGVRFDYLNGTVPAQTRLGGQFVDTFSIEQIDNVPNWKDVAPRLGVAYDLMGDGRTALKASLGRYVTAQGTGIAQAVNPANAIVTFANRTWTDVNMDFVPDCDLQSFAVNGECGALSDSGFGTPRVATRYDPDLLEGFGVREYNWQTTASIQHELRPGWSVEATYFRTSFGNFTVTDNLLVTPEDYDPYSITVPGDPRLPGGGGNQLTGLYDINPAKFGQVDLFVTSAENFGDQTEVYNGVDVSFDGRVGDGTLLAGGVSVGRTVSDNCFAVDSPEQARPGFCTFTPPWSTGAEFKFNGSYQLPLDTQIAWVLQYLPGIGRQANYSAGNAEIAPSLGRDLAAGPNARATVQLMPATACDFFGGCRSTEHEARQTQLDLRFTKIFRTGQGRIKGWVDIYNVFNANTVLSAVGQFGPSYLLPSAILGGRLVKFGGQFDW